MTPNRYEREEALCFAKILLAAEGHKQNLGLPGRSPGTLQKLKCDLFMLFSLFSI
jgi:hypothetical protein